MENKKINISKEVFVVECFYAVIVLALILNGVLNSYYPNLNFNGGVVFGICAWILFVPYIYILFKVYEIIELVKTGDIFTLKTSLCFKKMSIASHFGRAF